MMKRWGGSHLRGVERWRHDDRVWEDGVDEIELGNAACIMI